MSCRPVTFVAISWLLRYPIAAILNALLTDKVKVKEQLVEAEQSLEKIQEEEVRKSVSATDTQSEDEEESQFETKAQEVKVKEFSFSSSSESDSEEEERLEQEIVDLKRKLKKYAERPMWLPERCVHPVDVPADTKDHEDDPDSTNIGTGAMDVGLWCLLPHCAAVNALKKDGEADVHLRSVFLRDGGKFFYVGESLTYRNWCFVREEQGTSWGKTIINKGMLCAGTAHGFYLPYLAKKNLGEYAFCVLAECLEAAFFTLLLHQQDVYSVLNSH
ncbi:hypothetical protein STEG23_009298 [Scotinomys teguina]